MAGTGYLADWLRRIDESGEIPCEALPWLVEGLRRYHRSGCQEDIASCLMLDNQSRSIRQQKAFEGLAELVREGRLSPYSYRTWAEEVAGQFLLYARSTAARRISDPKLMAVAEVLAAGIHFGCSVSNIDKRLRATFRVPLKR